MQKLKVKKSSWNKGLSSWSKGKHLSDEHKERIRIGNLGRKNSEETKLKMSVAKKGVKRPNIAGENCYMWKGGITPKNLAIRMSTEYKVWMENVFKRDNWTCKECLQVGGTLNADHIKSFSLYPELRFDINNGRTLCESFHRKTETFGGKSNSIYIKKLALNK